MLKNNIFSQRIIFDFMEASGLDKEISETLLNDFCEQSLNLVCSVRKHIWSNNFIEASNLLHKLKGSAGNIRATMISKQALEAEEAIKLLDTQLLESLLINIDELLNALIEK